MTIFTNNTSLVIRIGADSRRYQQALERVRKNTRDLEAELGNIAKRSAIQFAALTGGATLAFKGYSDFEKALVGVGKTADIEGTRLNNLGKEFQELSQQIPTSTNELLEIAQIAGQLGIKGADNIRNFTKTVAEIADATDLSSENAASSFATILKLTGEPIENVDRLASTVVDLGNNFNATESQIVRVATQVGQATGQFGVSSKQVLAISTALRSVGVQAELGGSVVGKTFRKIEKSIRQGGSQFKQLQKITGLTGDQLRKTFAEDSTQVFEKFIKGLGNVDSVSATLEQFGLKGDEINKVLPTLANNSELLGKALETANIEFNRNQALAKEAAKANATSAAQTKKFFNAVENLTSSIGGALAPALTGIISNLTDVVSGLRSFSDNNPILVRTILAVTTATVTLRLAISTLGLQFVKARVNAIAASLAVAGFGKTSTSTAVNVGLLTKAVRLLGIVIKKNPLFFIGSALVAAGEALGLFSSDVSEATKVEEKYNQVLQETSNNAAEYISASEHRRLQIKQETKAKLEAAIAEFKLAQAQANTFNELSRTEKALARGASVLGLGPDLDVVEQKIQSSGRAIIELQDTLKGFEKQVNQPTPAITKTFSVSSERQNNDSTESASINKDIQERLSLLRDEAAINQRIAEQKRQLAQKADAGATLNELETIKANNERELALLREKQENKRAIIQAEQIESTQLREAELENLETQQKIILEREAAFIEQKKVLEAEAQQRRDEAQAFLREEEVILDKESFNKFVENFSLREEIENQYWTNIAKLRADQRKAEISNEVKFGKDIGRIVNTVQSQTFKSAKSTADSLVQIAQGRSKKLKGIQKAFAISEATVNIAAAISGAVRQAQTLPFPANLAAVATGVATVAANTANVINTIKGAQQGGIVPGPSLGDRVPSLLEGGETIVPAKVTPTFFDIFGSLAQVRDKAKALENINQNLRVEPAINNTSIELPEVPVRIVMNEQASKLISAEQRENEVLGINNRTLGNGINEG